MNELALMFTQVVYEQFQPLYANWEPSRPLKIGDYGRLKGRHFIYVGNIEDKLKTKVPVRDEHKKDQKFFSSKGSTEHHIIAKGAAGQSAVVAARASLEVRFSSDQAIFFNAAGCSYQMVRDKDALGKIVLGAHATGNWDRRWAIVTDLIQAGATTIAVSGGSAAAITFEATSDIPTIDLADASVGLGVKSSKNVGYQIAAMQGMTPLFGLCKIQRPFFWFQSEFEAVSKSATDPEFDEHGDEDDKSSWQFSQLR
jgi:hypothetical protein